MTIEYRETCKLHPLQVNKNSSITPVKQQNVPKSIQQKLIILYFSLFRLKNTVQDI